MVRRRKAVSGERKRRRRENVSFRKKRGGEMKIV